MAVHVELWVYADHLEPLFGGWGLWLWPEPRDALLRLLRGHRCRAELALEHQGHQIVAAAAALRASAVTTVRHAPVDLAVGAWGMVQHLSIAASGLRVGLLADFQPGSLVLGPSAPAVLPEGDATAGEPVYPATVPLVQPVRAIDEAELLFEATVSVVVADDPTLIPAGEPPPTWMSHPALWVPAGVSQAVAASALALAIRRRLVRCATCGAWLEPAAERRVAARSATREGIPGRFVGALHALCASVLDPAGGRFW